MKGDTDGARSIFREIFQRNRQLKLQKVFDLAMDSSGNTSGTFSLRLLENLYSVPSVTRGPY